jgi:hypothetical protein
MTDHRTEYSRSGEGRQIHGGPGGAKDAWNLGSRGEREDTMWN